MNNSRIPAVNLCDFCFRARPGMALYRRGCPWSCSETRSAEDWLGWPRYALIAADARDGLGRMATFAYYRDLHDRFWRARRGEAFRIAA